MTPSVRAWLVLAAGVIAYDLAAPKGHTLSEQVDRWLVSRPVLTRLVGAVVVLHLYNYLHPAVDPLHRVFTAGRRWKDRP